MVERITSSPLKGEDRGEGEKSVNRKIKSEGGGVSMLQERNKKIQLLEKQIKEINIVKEWKNVLFIDTQLKDTTEKIKVYLKK